MSVIVTGAAGFIGSHLVDYLLRQGYRVVGIDNFSAGRRENLREAQGAPGFKLIVSDLLEPGGEWLQGFRGADIVFHLAANPEVRHSTREPLDHYHQNVTATMHVLEAARRNSARLVVFASSSTVYGDPETIPTPETHPIKPISVYGATKAAGEILCQTYARLYGLQCLVLRYANIVGPRLRHGVIYDFIQKLRKNPKKLVILGDGSQRKSYLHVSDVADIVTEAMGLESVEHVYKPATPDGRGWPGDVKLMLLDIKRITSETGWRPRMSSKEAVRETAKQLVRELL